MSPLKSYLKATWPSLTVGVLVTTGGAVLARQTATKVKGIALAALGAYMLINHIALYCVLDPKDIKDFLKSFNEDPLTEKIQRLILILFLGLPLSIV